MLWRDGGLRRPLDAARRRCLRPVRRAAVRRAAGDRRGRLRQPGRGSRVAGAPLRERGRLPGGVRASRAGRRARRRQRRALGRGVCRRPDGARGRGGRGSGPRGVGPPPRHARARRDRPAGVQLRQLPARTGAAGRAGAGGADERAVRAARGERRGRRLRRRRRRAVRRRQACGGSAGGGASDLGDRARAGAADAGRRDAPPADGLRRLPRTARRGSVVHVPAASAADRRGDRGVDVSGRMRQLRFHWRHELAASPEALWPLVADTDRFNRDTGVPPVEVLGTGANAWRRLRLRRLGVPIEWEEEPFEWLRPERFGVVRRYSRGPIAEMRVQARLEAREDGGTHLDYDVRVRPRNLLGRLAAVVQVGLLSRFSFARAFRDYDRLASATPEPARPARLAPGGGARLRRGAETLHAQGLDPQLVESLVRLLERGDEQALERLRPYELADAWQAGRRESLELLLHATRAGLTELRWELLCPSCRGAAASVASLRELESAVHCDTCGIDVSADLERSVELIFTASPSLRDLDRREFCVGGPQVSPHVVAQQLLGPGEERSLTVRLEPGTYQVRALGEAAGDVFGASGETTVTLTNDSAGERLLRLERAEWRDRAATAAEVAALQAFRDLFSTEVLRPGEPVSVGTLTVLFTDLRGSTRFYREVGDPPAFGSGMA